MKLDRHILSEQGDEANAFKVIFILQGDALSPDTADLLDIVGDKIALQQ